MKFSSVLEVVCIIVIMCVTLRGSFACIFTFYVDNIQIAIAIWLETVTCIL